MKSDVRPVFVIQHRETGLFLAEDLSYSRSFKGAGRLYELQEAVDTALDNLDPGEFEIHQFWDLVRGG